MTTFIRIQTPILFILFWFWFLSTIQQQLTSRPYPTLLLSRLRMHSEHKSYLRYSSFCDACIFLSDVGLSLFFTFNKCSSFLTNFKEAD